MHHQLDNIVVKTLVNSLRDARTDAFRFRYIVRELAKLLACEALAGETPVQKEIETWKGAKSFGFVDEENLLFVTVLRAGLPMLESLGDLFPASSSGFLAIKRDEGTHESVLYYDRLPDCTGKTVVIVDPMVATGGSLCDAISLVEQRSPAKIISLNIIGAPEGLNRIEREHPGVDLYIAQIDEELDENKFIIPGLGDAGDRSYNTV